MSKNGILVFLMRPTPRNAAILYDTDSCAGYCDLIRPFPFPFLFLSRREIRAWAVNSHLIKRDCSPQNGATRN